MSIGPDAGAFVLGLAEVFDYPQGLTGFVGNRRYLANAPEEPVHVAVIETTNLGRSFRQARRFDGPLGSIRTLLTREYTTRHALKDISFTIEPG